MLLVRNPGWDLIECRYVGVKEQVDKSNWKHNAYVEQLLATLLHMFDVWVTFLNNNPNTACLLYISTDTNSVNKCLLIMCRVQETDGSFFESYTAVSWKLENRRLKAMQESGGDNPPPGPAALGIRPPGPHNLHPKEVRSKCLTSEPMRKHSKENIKTNCF